jgi:hypothetical protein
MSAATMCGWYLALVLPCGKAVAVVLPMAGGKSYMVTFGLVWAAQSLLSVDVS